ncbi:hypothetical protein [Natranaeroarchaeum aerophilus]|uniref:Uncharacterized protein n=1 Tax=Natranaeroarchaeum aerophilus TaxID=2917711 RepID=A0AAE3FSX1_9EURY|nr:hypothetical protein [Natranaeroarchaeum aerophilus]MCL9814009.1 hypothetical protein [Natranaeroarchaeum aerophilus]
MNIHRLKCRLGLHDWEYSRRRFDDVVLVEKQCLWCSAETAAASYPAEDRGQTESSVRVH